MLERLVVIFFVATAATLAPGWLDVFIISVIIAVVR
jgi:hypothetical protein